MTDQKTIEKRILGIPGAIKVRDGGERHPIENIPGVIVVKRAAPKPKSA